MSELHKLLAAVTDQPETADAIFRRYAEVAPYKSLGKVLRRRRSAVGAMLEHMAERGLIERIVRVEHFGHVIEFRRCLTQQPALREQPAQAPRTDASRPASP